MGLKQQKVGSHDGTHFGNHFGSSSTTLKQYSITDFLQRDCLY